MGANLKQGATGGAYFEMDNATDKGRPSVDMYPGNAVQSQIVGQVTGGSANSGVAVPLGTLPRNAMITAVRFFGAAASNAGTAATLSLGFSGGSYVGTEILNAEDVKTTATGKGQVVPNGAADLGAVISASADIPVVGTYTETGTASTAGGPWTVVIDYYKTAP